MPNPSNSDLVGEDAEPLLANLLVETPDAPEYARLQYEYLCHGAGYARGERLEAIFEDAMRTLRAKEVALAELAQQLEQAREEIEEWKVEAERGKWPKEKAQAFFRYRSALNEIVGQDPVELALDPQWSQRIARAALTPDEGADR